MARWNSCNVLRAGGEPRQLWQFSGSGKFNLLREETKSNGEPLNEKLVSKDWQTLFQPRLNIAWLPADKVFLRAVQLPAADPAELHSMVDLQLEKLSPVPVAQVVWSYHLLQQPVGDLQTIVVIIVPRNVVEEYLGKLEGQGYLADRLELPFLDQLQAMKVDGDGAWIYPGLGGDNSCLVAWWYGGFLQNLSLINLPPNEARGMLLQGQLSQMIWAGELEGWLTQAPRFHLVADGATAEFWKTLFTPEQAVEVVPPPSPQELAARTARRVAANSLHTNLLPPEYAARYKQQFVDRLWMRGIGAVVMIYMAVVLIYLGMVQFADWQYGKVQDQVTTMGSSYTNALQLKEKVKVLQDQLELQYAALECYRAAAEKLPDGLVMDSMALDRGRKLTLTGTAGSDDVTKIHSFNEALRAFVDKSGKQTFFSKVNPPTINPKPGGGHSWTFACELKRTEME